MKLKIRILTIIIVLLPVTEVFIVSSATFIDYSNYWREIKIPAGNHSYYPSIKFRTDLTEIEFYFRANESWYYDEPVRNGWNKLRGFSKGMHKAGGSARLVYKCINDTLLLVGGYCYVNGVHPNNGVDQQATIDTIYPNEIYHCVMKHEDDKFKFYFEDKYWECDATLGSSWGYMLNPFIGGVFTLDHDWTIDLLDIEHGDEELLQAFEPGL